MNAFILPEKWIVEVNDDNRGIINNWKIKQEYNDNLFKNLDYIYVDSEGGGYAVKDSYAELCFEITFEQFEEYVLGIKKETIIDNYDYLIEVLNKYNIK